MPREPRRWRRAIGARLRSLANVLDARPTVLPPEVSVAGTRAFDSLDLDDAPPDWMRRITEAGLVTPPAGSTALSVPPRAGWRSVRPVPRRTEDGGFPGEEGLPRLAGETRRAAAGRNIDELLLPVVPGDRGAGDHDDDHRERDRPEGFVPRDPREEEAAAAERLRRWPADERLWRLTLGPGHFPARAAGTAGVRDVAGEVAPDVAEGGSPRRGHTQTVHRARETRSAALPVSSPVLVPVSLPAPEPDLDGRERTWARSGPASIRFTAPRLRPATATAPVTDPLALAPAPKRRMPPSAMIRPTVTPVPPSPAHSGQHDAPVHIAPPVPQPWPDWPVPRAASVDSLAPDKIDQVMTRRLRLAAEQRAV